MALWQEVRFNALEVCNFKAFYGTHRLNLRTFPEEGKNLVLIGAQNNVGKTTLMEAIYYTLYDIGELPNINKKPSYIRAVWERLNRDARSEGIDDFHVALELTVKGKGFTRDLRIIRRWTIVNPDSQLINWQVEVEEEGKPLVMITDDTPAYKEFLANTIPHNIASFFLFDGERIQQFAEDEQQEEFTAAVEAILQIDLYKQLRSDIKQSVIRPLEKEAAENTEDTPIDYLRKRDDTERDLKRLDAREREIEHERTELDKAYLRDKRELSRLGSPKAAERDELFAEKARLEREQDEYKQALQALIDHLPLSFSPLLQQSLIQRLATERAFGATHESRRELKTRLTRLEHTLLDGSEGAIEHCQLSTGQGDWIKARYWSCSDDVFELSETLDRRIHDISDQEAQDIHTSLHETGRQLLGLSEVIRQRNLIDNHLREITKDLDVMSDEPLVDELVENMGRIKKEIGQLDQELKELQGNRQRLQSDLASINREIEKQRQRTEKRTDALRKIDLAEKVLYVLDDFIEKFRPSRIKQLEGNFKQMYAQIAKETDIVGNIEFDPDTFEIILHDKSGRDPFKRQFSAGWKQMYAYALLWALAKTSGYSLPIVIDTPVGRLDIVNRESIFLKYLPNAGKQVVVLCTDTELPPEWASRLQPFVARQYLLEAEKGTGHTIVKEGFFK